MKVRHRLLIMLFTVVCFGQQLQVASLATIPDITGTGALVAITPGTPTYARGIQITCPSTNSANVYWGDTNTSATRGSMIAPGGGQYIPSPTPRSSQPSPNGAVFDLSTVYLFIGSGDKVKITYQPY